jgi:hypothetical protein
MNSLRNQQPVEWISMVRLYGNSVHSDEGLELNRQNLDSVDLSLPFNHPIPPSSSLSFPNCCLICIFPKTRDAHEQSVVSVSKLAANYVGQLS